MELHKTKVKATAAFDLRGTHQKSTLIMPIGDIQAGVEDCDLRMLKDHIQWGVDHNAYFVGMGDYIDFASPSNRQRLRSAGLYRYSVEVLDELGRKKVEELYEEALKPSVGHWLGLVSGHHGWVFDNGMPTDALLAEKLDAPYLGDCAVLGLQYDEGIVEMWVHHGVGGSQTLGGALNRVERLTAAWPSVHIFLVAHQHKMIAGRPERMLTNWETGEQEHMSVVIACTGSFLKGYPAGRMGPGGYPEGSYVEQHMLPPVSLGGILLHVTPRTRNGFFVPDIAVSL